MDLSVVIPIYHTAKNAVAHLPGVIHDLRKHMDSFEILFIIDNENIDEDIKGLFILQQTYPEIHIRQLRKNHGQHFATLCGYYLAKGNYILSIDEDMTKYIPEICKSEEYKSFDVYYWFYDKNTMYTSDIRKAFSNLFKLLIEKIVNFQKNSTFRMINRELRNKLITEKHIFWNIDIMIFDNTGNTGGRHIEQFDVKDDESSYNYKKLLRVAIEIPYEHNTIFMNLLIALIPSFLYQMIYQDLAGTLVVYGITFFIIQSLFIALKQLTPATEKKIQQAIQA
jgi:hypothetical protein